MLNSNFNRRTVKPRSLAGKNLTTIIVGIMLLLSFKFVAAQDWSLTGNAATNPSTQFLGTTDNKALKLRTNNSVRLTISSAGKVGIGTSSPAFKLDVKGGSINTDSVYRIGGITVLSVKGAGNAFAGAGAGVANTTGYFNAAIGAYALQSNTTGAYNSANGSYALQLNTTGEANTADGAFALNANTTGSYNSASGCQALQFNTTGHDNTANGYLALYSNTNGSYNSATGNQALSSNTSGFENTANGWRALYANTSGSYNCATGFRALNANSTGNYNTANGHSALYSNSNGTYNSAFGAYSLYVNSTGNYNTAAGVEALRSNTNGSYNTANGYQALYSNTAGFYNTANGCFALESNVSGYYNTAIGYYALNLNTGNRNTAVGYTALNNNTTAEYNTAIGWRAGGLYDYGWFNTFIGAECDANNNGYTNSIALGDAAIVTASSQTRIGNTSTTSTGAYTGWSNISDGRFKSQIQNNVPGLEFISKLRPVTYHLEATKLDEFLHKNSPMNLSNDGKKIYDKALKDKEAITYTGFIAQEVEAAAKELSFDFSGVDKPKNDDDPYGLRYAEFVVPLVKAVQELDEENGKLKMENSDQQKQIDELNSKMEQLLFDRAQMGMKSEITNPKSDLSRSDREIPSLGQNIPNPFGNSTLIPFRIPEGCSNASIMITNTSTSQVISVIPISCDEDHVSVNANTLASGTYSYALFVDGKLIDKKEMVITK